MCRPTCGSWNLHVALGVKAHKLESLELNIELGCTDRFKRTRQIIHSIYGKKCGASGEIGAPPVCPSMSLDIKGEKFYEQYNNSKHEIVNCMGFGA